MHTIKRLAALLGVAALLGLTACSVPRYPQPLPPYPPPSEPPTQPLPGTSAPTRR